MTNGARLRESMKQAESTVQGEPGPAPEEQPNGLLSGLVTMRMIAIFSLLRRREILAHRQQFGLSEIEWHIMTLAGEHAPFSLSRLAALTLKDEGQLSRAVKKMVARGLLSRQRKPGGPEIEIALTDEGWSVYQNMVQRAIARDRWLTSEIAPEDIKALWRITETMIGKAQELVSEEPKPEYK
jgi:DNA-binding MarR family transcriptional regulator